jgi:hypothetical protein
MKQRYEIKDSRNQADRGMRFTSLRAAQRELSHACPPGRFYIYDRQDKREV